MFLVFRQCFSIIWRFSLHMSHLQNLFLRELKCSSAGILHGFRGSLLNCFSSSFLYEIPQLITQRVTLVFDSYSEHISVLLLPNQDFKLRHNKNPLIMLGTQIQYRLRDKNSHVHQRFYKRV